MALMSSEYGFFRNALGALGIIALSPLILLVVLLKIVMLPFDRPAIRTPSFVADSLRRFLADDPEATGYWDAFTSVPIADPELESIRQSAEMVQLPLDAESRAQLEALLARAEALSAQDLSTSTSSRVR